MTLVLRKLYQINKFIIIDFNVGTYVTVSLACDNSRREVAFDEGAITYNAIYALS